MRSYLICRGHFHGNAIGPGAVICGRLLHRPRPKSSCFFLTLSLCFHAVALLFLSFVSFLSLSLLGGLFFPWAIQSPVRPFPAPLPFSGWLILRSMTTSFRYTNLRFLTFFSNNYSYTVLCLVASSPHRPSHLTTPSLLGVFFFFFFFLCQEISGMRQILTSLYIYHTLI